MPPTAPPTQWMPTTSRLSSNPTRNLASIAKKQTTPAIAPNASECIEPTKPAAGVMATSAATTPEAMPMVDTRWCRAYSANAQPTMPAAAAMNVLTNACAAAPSAASAEPALNPNQPNHRMPAPSMTNGTLWGTGRLSGQPERLPTTSASAMAAAPAFTWMAVPPAKSWAGRLKIQPSAPYTQYTTGEYTSSDHTGTNTIQAENFMRSATAPEMSAGVMAANVMRKANVASPSAS